ncbi:hypothetical protein BO82DRAFT_349560 [Aspergillus uvarum CBS 121591]|uniref:Uncharacterized protein n=1 Tax=Aspergillus uvarum CBS 121591 TaxID=1448315 RepID=A0A319D7S2_9EURO|nr:hypothetical protein BO82DRAFT_349560 [Aspergillus uvarum CBS 121591]PYH87023.1 hypothetical protein BO82DRAFT_349560 [Aspergillus uvarum CBS 121591]
MAVPVHSHPLNYIVAVIGAADAASLRRSTSKSLPMQASCQGQLSLGHPGKRFLIQPEPTPRLPTKNAHGPTIPRVEFPNGPFGRH